jgi:hypothetical protein
MAVEETKLILVSSDDEAELVFDKPGGKSERSVNNDPESIGGSSWSSPGPVIQAVWGNSLSLPSQVDMMGGATLAAGPPTPGDQTSRESRSASTFRDKTGEELAKKGIRNPGSST